MNDGSNMIQVINIITGVFNTCIQWMRDFKILPNVSLLTFDITLLIMAILFPVLINIVKIGNRNVSNKEKKDEKE